MLERWTGKAPRHVKHQKDDAAGATALFYLVSERRVIRTPRACVSPFGTNDSLSLGCRRPAKALKIVIDAEHLPNAWITVSIDDRVIVKDAPPFERRWRQAIDLREFIGRYCAAYASPSSHAVLAVSHTLRY